MKEGAESQRELGPKQQQAMPAAVKRTQSAAETNGSKPGPAATFLNRRRVRTSSSGGPGPPAGAFVSTKSD